MDKGIIKKLNTHELVGWEDEPLMDVYPITAISAVYDENNKSLADILKELRGGSGSGSDSGSANPIKTKFLQIYKSSSTQPVTPSGGAYSFDDGTLTIPDGWVGSSEGLASPIWSSYGSATSNVDGIIWSVPVCISGSVTEGILKRCYVAIVYKSSEIQPATPIGGSYDFGSNSFSPPDGWSTNADKTTTNAEQWCSIRAFYNDGTETTWSTPCRAAEANVTLTAAQLEVIADKVKLTTNDLDVIAGKINLNADQIEAVAKAVTLTTDELKVIANNTTLSATELAVIAQNVDFTAENLNTIAEKVTLKADQLDTIARKVTLNADQVEYVVKSLTVNADLIDAISSKVETDVEGTLAEYKSEWAKTAEEIKATVSANKTDANNQITNLSSLFSQTATGFQATVDSYTTGINNQISELNSKFTLTASELSTEFNEKVTEVSNQVTTLSNKFTSTASQMSSELSEYKTEEDKKIAQCNSNIIQATNKIEAFTNKFTFNDDGNVTNIETSGFLTQADKTAIYSKIETVDGKILSESYIQTMIENDLAKVKIYGDDIILDANHAINITSPGQLVIDTANFKLDANGQVTATGGTFTGTVNATSGTIGSGSRKLTMGSTSAGGVYIGLLEDDNQDWYNGIGFVDDVTTYLNILSTYSTGRIYAQFNYQGVSIYNYNTQKFTYLNAGYLNMRGPRGTVLLDTVTNVSASVFKVTGLPTTKPTESGCVYNDNGTLKIVS